MLKKEITHEKDTPLIMISLCFKKTSGENRFFVGSRYCRKECKYFSGIVEKNGKKFVNCKAES
ncbi:MAG: hypothetical protein KAT32_00615 [Candidatus Moranbacteria bacterium]|nr:hypothetical protein [Candidatus Moranbacteria bacterium]